MDPQNRLPANQCEGQDACFDSGPEDGTVDFGPADTSTESSCTSGASCNDNNAWEVLARWATSLVGDL